MQTVDEELETIHVYVVREEAPRPSLFPIFLSAVALSILVVFSALTPYQQPVTRMTIRIPAVLLPLKTFTAQVAVIPTGVRVYPATAAHGTLTITNGSVIAQILPAGFIPVSNTSVSVVTDKAVFVPAGNANGYGSATVPAHALTSGRHGNIPAYAINQVEGSSIYIRNLTAFYGGRDAYSVKFAITQDKVKALQRARTLLVAQAGGLHYPCKEIYRAAADMVVIWRCQFLTYHVSAYMHVTGIKLQGKSLVVDVVFVARPIRIWVK
jgi:hypothetical protein